MIGREKYQPIVGKWRANFRNHSVAYVKKNGSIGIRRPAPPSCRNLWWQEAAYKKAIETGRWDAFLQDDERAYRERRQNQQVCA